MKLLEQLKKQKKILEEQWYNVAYICVYGSQNYGMAVYTPEYTSDVDMKAIIIPSLDNLVYNSKPISTSIETEWGLCDLKDIRSYAEMLGKANPVYIETLFTDFYICNHPDFLVFREMRDEIVFSLSCLFFRGAQGQVMMKREALCHPYPSIADKVEKYGYDPKQLHHIARLFFLLTDFAAGKVNFTPSPEERDVLIGLKTIPRPLEEAIRLADQMVTMVKTLVEQRVFSNSDNYDIKTNLQKIAQDIIKDSIQKSICSSK